MSFEATMVTAILVTIISESVLRDRIVKLLNYGVSGYTISEAQVKVSIEDA